jgi:hypothetical protein
MKETSYAMATPPLTSNNIPDRDLVDSVTYLASLASDPKAIDPALDKLRMITARWSGDTALNAQDKQTLQGLIATLKDNLMHHDLLRSFSEDSLEAQLRDKLRAPVKAASKWGGFAGIVAACALLSAASILIPSSLPVASRGILAISVFQVFLTLAGSWFYLSSLRSFKPALRRAFIWLCLGAVALATQFVHFAYEAISGQSHTPLYRYGGLATLACLAAIAMYRGLQLYSRALKLDTVWAKTRWALVGSAAMAVFAIVVAYLSPVPEKGYFAFSLASVCVLNIMALMGARVARAILRAVTPAYAASMRLLYICLFAIFIGTIGHATTLIVVRELGGTALALMLGIFATPAMLMLMYSGYSFKRETR